MSDKLDLSAEIGVDASAAISALKATERAVELMADEFENASGAVKEHTTGLAAAARAIASLQKSIDGARLASAKVDELTSRTTMNNRKAEEAAERSSAAVTVKAEADKTAARRKAEQDARRMRTNTGDVGADKGKQISRNLSPTLGYEKDVRSELKSLGDHYRAIEAEQERVSLARIRTVESAERQSNDRRIADNRRRAQEVFGGSTGPSRQSAATAVGIRDGEEAANKARIAANRARAQDVFGLPDTGTLNQTRYALYDVANTLGVLGGAITATGVAAVGFATKYESAFTNVERTNIGAPAAEIEGLRKSLLGLSERIPVNFSDLTEIATIGSQLGIATQDVDKFTETTAKFAAVTGVSIEQSGKGFGALSNLLKVPAQDFEKLGSSIGATGVDAVATEAEILSLATAIGAAATQANFGAAETIGLSSALASLRVQPEQARGVILRMFSKFDEAVSVGGEKLQQYAAVMGETTEGAKELWKSTDGSEKFFDAFVQGLSNAEDLNGTLRDLGIRETRERNVLQRLAGNYDVYADSIKLAQESFESGTFLDESYALVADDLASKLSVLVNSITNLAAAAGESLLPVLGPIIDILTSIAQGLSHLHPGFLGVITTVVTLTGMAALLVAGFAGFVASSYAVQSALIGIQKNAVGATSVWGALKQTVSQSTSALGINTAAAKLNSITIGSATGSIAAATNAIRGKTAASSADAAASAASATATTGAAVAARGLGAAILSIPLLNIVAGLSIAVPLILTAIDHFTGMSRAAEEAGNRLADAGGGIKAFRDTLAPEGTEGSFGKIVTSAKEMSDEMVRAKAEAAQLSAGVSEMTGTTDKLAEAVDGSTAAIQRRTMALTDDSVAWLQNALKADSKDNGLQEIAKDPQMLETMRKYGIDISRAIREGVDIEGGPAAALKKQMDDALNTATSEHTKKLTDATLYDLYRVEEVTSKLGGVRDSLQGIFDAVELDGATNEILGVKDAAEETEGVIESLGSAIKAAFEAMDIETNFLSAMDALNLAIEENGIHFDNLSAGGRANLSALSEALQTAAMYGQELGISTEESMARALLEVNNGAISTAQLLQQISALPATFRAQLDVSAVIDQVNRLAAMGISTGKGSAMSVKAKQSEVSRLTSKRDKLVAQQKSSGGGGGGRKPKSSGGGSKKAANNAKDSLKTVAEFARDMGTAMQAAFDSRFGLAKSMDDVASKFNSMAKTIADAKDKVRDLHNELSQLAADRNILEAQLKVAIDYEDELRADAIRAELAKSTATTADKTKNLAEASAVATMQMEGNTQAAIDNRNAVYGLISAYQGQIQAYAETGASAEQVSQYTRVLQGQFVQQLTQLGLNSAQVNHFASVFDSLAASVRAVPTHKVVTVTANTDGAEGRIAALGGSIRNLDGDIARLNREIDAASAKAAAAGSRQIQANALMRQASDKRIQAASYGAGALPGMRDSLYAQAEELERRARALRYARGGVIGGGGRPSNRGMDDTLIWAQKGEGIVKQQSMEWLGADGLKAINNMQNPFPQATVVQQAQPNYGSSTLVVELSAYDRSVQQQIADRVGVTIGSDTIASATNRHNGRLAQRGGS